MKRLHIVLIGVLVLLLQSCCNTNIPSETQNELENNYYLGEWYSVKRITPFGATLRIDSSYTFNYEGGACLMNFGAKGIWNLNGDTLLLNSFEPEGCYYLLEFEPDFTVININDSIFPKPPTTKENCTPVIDYYYIQFRNARFLIIDSVLTHIPKVPKLCSDIRDDFIRTKYEFW